MLRTGRVVVRRTVPVPGGRLAAMSANPKAAAPRLRAVREAWLGRAIERLEADPAISAAGFVGSLGRGDADDWSDVDLLIVVPDDQVSHYADATQLPRPDLVTWSIDARHNAPRGASAIGIDYGIDGLPLHVDWHVYPRSQVAWVADARVIFDEQGLRRLDDTFREHLDKREVQPPAPKAANAHRLLQLSLMPVAAKYVARRSADAGRMVEFVGGPYLPEATPAEYLTMLRRLLAQYRDGAPE
jgi:predicted nucleotidyltransferase